MVLTRPAPVMPRMLTCRPGWLREWKLWVPGIERSRLLPSWRSAIATRSLPTAGAKPSRVAGTYWLAPAPGE